MHGQSCLVFGAGAKTCFSLQKGKSHTQEVLQLLDTLKLMIRNLAENIAKRWKFQMFARIVLKTLHRSNRHDVRMAAFECLLMLMDIFGEDPDDNVQGFTLPAFAKALDLSPFTGQGAAPLNDPDALCPASEPLTKQDVASMWEFLLNFATHREDNFEFWYELLKTNYLSVFYSDECMSIGLPVDQSTTFAVCPYELQVKIIKQLTMWDSHKYLARTIWSDVNAPIMLGYCTHACKMPLAYAKETTECIKLFSSVFFRKNVGGSEEPMRAHWNNWQTSLSRVFFIQSQPASPELVTHRELCGLVVDVYRHFVVDFHHEMTKEHWQGIQTLLIDVVSELLSNNDCTQVQTIAEVISEPLMDVMLVAWIGSQHTTPEMWDHLRGKIGALLGWKAVLLQWQQKVLVVTQIVISQLYKARGAAPAGPGRKSLRRDTMFTQNIGERATATDDPRISSLDWSGETALEMWFLILRLLGSPINVTVGELFQTSLGCLASVIELLMQAEVEHFSDETDPAPIDVFEVFCPWLFEATVVDSKRSRGAVVAYTLLCDMFLQMRDRTHDGALLAHFYRVIVSGLSSGHSAISWCVIRNCRALFWLNLPGAEVVMPHILEQVENTFGPKGIKNPPPEKVQTRFLSLMSAMICHSAHFQRYCPEDAALFDRVVDSFVLVAGFSKCSVPKSLCTCICGLASCVFQEVRDRRRSEVIWKCIKTILVTVTHENVEVCNVSLQMLSSLSHIANDIREIDTTLLERLVCGLCSSGQAILAANRNPLVANILYSILEILLAGDAHNESVASTVFGFCEAAICHHRPGATNGGNANSVRMSKIAKKGAQTAAEPKEKEEQKRGKFVDKLRKKDKPGPATAEPEPEQEVAVDVRDVQDAGETVAEMLCAHLDNFPAPAGPEICECREYDGKKHQGDDDMNPNTIFWIFGDSALLSMRQVDPCTCGPIVRVTLRNMTGRFVWDAKLQYEPLREKYTYGVPLETSVVNLEDATFEEMVLRKTSCNINADKEPRQAGVLPTVDTECQRDGLFETLCYLHEKHGVIVPSKNVTFTEPYQTVNLAEEEMSHYETSLEFQDEDERNHIEVKPRGVLHIVPQPIDYVGSTFHWARIFFAQMGFTTENMLNMMCLVDNSDKFRRTLKELDKRQNREHVKVGCLRVARGHATQKEMLHLEARSAGFRDMVDAMAWSVDLESHLGFGGQLPKRGSAPYWASQSTELVFHDTTRMPTDDGDEQQIQKKKHVGNDHVSVIWSEHYAEYDPEVIKSQFNFVHVIVYPLMNGLHRVQVKKKDQIPFFGPLVDGALVSPVLLPLLVRATLINANRVVRVATTQGAIVRPVQARAKLLQEIAVKYRKEVDFRSMMMEIMSPNITPGYEAPAEPEDSVLSDGGTAAAGLRVAAPKQVKRPPPPTKAPAGAATSLLQRGSISVRKTPATGAPLAKAPSPIAKGSSLRKSSPTSEAPMRKSSGADQSVTAAAAGSGDLKKLPAPPAKKALPAQPPNRGSTVVPTKTAITRTGVSPRGHASGPAGLVESAPASKDAPASSPRGLSPRAPPPSGLERQASTGVGRGTKLAPRPAPAPKPKVIEAPEETAGGDDE